MIAPDGTRVELFTGKGKRWRGKDFQDTIFDDEAAISITDARPPFLGSVQPDGINIKNKPTLSAFYGKPVKGVWRLFLRATRTPSSGLLNGWALNIRPETKPTSKQK